MRRLLPCVCCLVLVVVPAFSWWETGHEVVARIAASQLTPAVQTHVARILGVPDTREAVANALATASIWADQVKEETKTGDWHYINLISTDRRGEESKRCPDQDCLPERIKYFEDLLEEHPDRPDSRWTDAEALKMLVHLVGDSSQPLHAITDADAGGNCEKLNPPVDGANNLHALWDGGLIRAMHENDVALAAELERQIDQMSNRERRRLARGDVMDWVWDSHEIAERDIYERLHIPDAGPEMPKGCDAAPDAIRDFTPNVDAGYIDAMIPVVKLQLIKGGLRLARVLNETL